MKRTKFLKFNRYNENVSFIKYLVYSEITSLTDKLTFIYLKLKFSGIKLRLYFRKKSLTFYNNNDGVFVFHYITSQQIINYHYK